MWNTLKSQVYFGWYSSLGLWLVSQCFPVDLGVRVELAKHFSLVAHVAIT